MFSVPANLLITVPEDNDATPFQQDSANLARSIIPKWNLWTLIWNVLFALGSIVAKIILILIWALVPVTENFTRRLEGIAIEIRASDPKIYKFRTKECSSDLNWKILLHLLLHG